MIFVGLLELIIICFLREIHQVCYYNCYLELPEAI
jgi:hypothetical protein